MNSFANHVIEKVSDDGTPILVKELNLMHIENLKEFGIEEQAQTTWFAKRLVNNNNFFQTMCIILVIEITLNLNINSCKICLQKFNVIPRLLQ